jgi:hypothetical protein
MGILRNRMIEEMKLTTTNHRISSARRTFGPSWCILRWNGSYRAVFGGQNIIDELR